MEDVRIYNFEGQLLHIEPNMVSSTWTLKYNGVGSFEGHYPAGCALTALVTQTPYLVAVQGDKQAILTGKTLTDGELVVYGRTPNWLLSRRTLPPFGHTTAGISQLAHSMVLGGFSDDKGRAVPPAFDGDDGVALVPGAELPQEVTFWRNTTNPANEVIADLLDRAGAGHAMTFVPALGDGRDEEPAEPRWHFAITRGAELPLVVSPGNRNGYETEVTEDLLDYYTEGWYEQQTAGGQEPQPEEQAALSAAEPGTWAGEPNPEQEGEQEAQWIKLVREEKHGIYRWVGVLSGTSESEAATDLAKKALQRDITMKTRGLSYGTDYQLGDIVTVEHRVGGQMVSSRQRITEVTLWYEHNDAGQQPVFQPITQEEDDANGSNL